MFEVFDGSPVDSPFDLMAAKARKNKQLRVFDACKVQNAKHHELLKQNAQDSAFDETESVPCRANGPASGSETSFCQAFQYRWLWRLQRDRFCARVYSPSRALFS